MDLRLRPCTQRDSIVLGDRLSSLPDEVLIHILSLLPTKYAAATCVLSRRLYRVFPWITILDFDDSPISFCVKKPCEIERFPTFVTFVNSVLHAYKSLYLTRFRLQVGMSFFSRYMERCNPYGWGCQSECLSDLRSAQISSWICFPLNHCGLRELDLRMHIRCEPSDGQLPPEIFTCETLEVLKLDVNLYFDQVSTFCLPKLKLLHLHASLISEDSFLTRLVSSCPLLEDLTDNAWWNRVLFTNISSTSLRRLCLIENKFDDETENTDFVLIHTPNLEYFQYIDNLAIEYSIPMMHSLVKAEICMHNDIGNDYIEDFQQILKLIRPLSNVQHLALSGLCNKDLNCFVEVKDELPLFRNLKYLELGYYHVMGWDKVLLSFLNQSPVLETLTFPEGVASGGRECKFSIVTFQRLALEREFCKSNQAIPLCCQTHLKSIVIKRFYGTKREIDLIQFLLRHALVLRELVLWRAPKAVADLMTLESTLNNLPRASVICSIQVHNFV